MSRYEVQRPRRARVALPEAAAAALVALAALALVWQAFMRVGVTVDGARRTVTVGMAVADLLASGLSEARPGDLVALDGTVLLPGGGGRPLAEVDGAPAPPGHRLRGGERVRLIDGADVTERVISAERPIPIPVSVTGTGPLVRLASTGAVGVEAVRLGELSGQVVASETLQPAVPMTVVRVTPPPTGGKLVALTFDDGPWPESTERILDILAKEKVPATFFVVGKRVAKQPGLVRRMVREGHLVANHTEDHRVLTLADRNTVRRQIRQGANSIKAVTGKWPRWFRPPGGYLDPVVLDEARKANERLVLWSVDPQDWRRPRWKKLAAQVIEETEPGGVVLLHDGGGDRTATVKALLRIVPRLKRKGYRFVTLDELEAAERRAAAGEG